MGTPHANPTVRLPNYESQNSYNVGIPTLPSQYVNIREPVSDLPPTLPNSEDEASRRGMFPHIDYSLINPIIPDVDHAPPIVLPLPAMPTLSHMYPQHDEHEPPDDNDSGGVLGPVVQVISHAYDMKVEDDYRGQGHAEIHMWTLDRESAPHLLRVRDFPIFCHMELPQFVDGRIVEWTEGSANRMVEWLVKALGDDKPTGWMFSMKPKIYYYRANRMYPMLLLMFKTVKAMYHCQNLVAKPRQIQDFGTVKMEMWETSISAIRKMFSLREVRYSQWFRIQGQEVPLDHEDRCCTRGAVGIPIREYIVSWKSMTAIDPSESKGWMTNPRIVAFDIETYSDNHRQMPKEYNAKHCAYIISCIYQRLGDPSSRRKFVIVKGECDDIPGCERVIRVKTEVEEINAMGALIMELDPEVVTGYNILSYDYPYLDVRIKTKMRDWPQMGRIAGQMPIMTSKSWKSSAYGHNRINILQMEGRISIDMLPIVRRDFKLDKYDLNSVCLHFLKKGKHDIKAAEMFRIYERLTAAQKSFDVAVQSEAVTPQVVDDLEVAQQAFDVASSEPTPHQVVFMAKDVHDKAVVDGGIPADIQEEYDKAKAEMTRVVAYCIQDSELVIDLFEMLNVWIGLVELSSIVGVTITDLFTRGQQIRCQSQVYNLASNIGYVIDKRQVPKMFFNGGFVFEPKAGLYENIICLDFASLYPSIMEAYNICFSTLVPPELNDLVDDSLCNVIEFDQEETPSGLPRSRGGNDEDGEGFIEGVNDDAVADDDDDEETPKGTKDTKAPKTVKRHYRFKFVKAEHRRGILPQLVHDLVAERNVVRKQAKGIEVYIKSMDKLRIAMESQKLTVAAFLATIPGEIACLDPTDGSADIKSLQAWEAILLTCGNIDNAQFLAYAKATIASCRLQVVVLDKRQLALKVSANSMFGFLGAQNGGLMPLIEGAMCITAMGRQLIGEVNKYVEDKYGAEIIYNDTDSSMIDMHIKDIKDCCAWGQRLMDEISGTPEKKLDNGTVIPAVKGLFPPPLRMEFEKAMRLLCIKKKKYAAYLIKKDGTFEKDKDTGETIILKKGIVLARRDNHRFLRDTYMSLLRCVLDRSSMEFTYGVLIDAMVRLLQGKVVPKGTLTIIRELGAEYKNPNYFMKVFSGELARMGKPVLPGDRLEYVVVRTVAETKGFLSSLGEKMRSIDMWEEAREEQSKRVSEGRVASKEETDMVYPVEDIDYMYYIENTMMNAIDQLFSIGYMKELKTYDEIGYKPQYSRCHYSSISSPVKMLCKMVADLLKGYAMYSNSESEKLQVISQSVAGLPEWFINRRKEVDGKITADAETKALRDAAKAVADAEAKVLDDANIKRHDDFVAPWIPQCTHMNTLMNSFERHDPEGRNLYDFVCRLFSDIDFTNVHLAKKINITDLLYLRGHILELHKPNNYDAYLASLSYLARYENEDPDRRAVPRDELWIDTHLAENLSVGGIHATYFRTLIESKPPPVRKASRLAIA